MNQMCAALYCKSFPFFDTLINPKNIGFVSYHLLFNAFQESKTFILILFNAGLFQTLNSAMIHMTS